MSDSKGSLDGVEIGSGLPDSSEKSNISPAVPTFVLCPLYKGAIAVG